jgi:hypothetical protein
MLHRKHKIAACHIAKEGWVQLSRLYKLFSAVLGNPKQEHFRICKWKPKKRDPIRWWGIAKDRTFQGTGGPYLQTIFVYFITSRGRFLAFSDTVFDTLHVEKLNIRPYKIRYKILKRWVKTDIIYYLHFSIILQIKHKNSVYITQ